MINIFTDASVIKSIYDETIGCAGAICSEDVSIAKYEIDRCSTNNISEINAVKLAVELAIENEFESVNIWADSQFAIYGLTKWNRSWMNNMVNHHMYSSSGELVKNQQIFLYIIKLIANNNLKVNFFHIKGHVKENDLKSINNAVTTFQRSNSANISRSEIIKAIRMNNLVDKTTRDLLKDFKNIKPVELTRGIINPILSNEEIIKYYSLVTIGGNTL